MADPFELCSQHMYVYDNFFERSDFHKIIELTDQFRWQFGHTSYDQSRPEYNLCSKFWKVDLNEDLFFSDYLLNKIQEKTKQSFILNQVYANGHTYGLDGMYHQDGYDDSVRTFLLYANPEWRNEWGGGTQFFVDKPELRHVMFEPNRAVLFPGMVYHSAAPVSRLFNGLRISIAWKLKVKC